MNNRITVVENILNANDEIALRNRKLLDKERIFSVNVMASPGAGKTSFLEKTIMRLKNRYRLAVIDGDITTNLDADRASAAGAYAIQVNTGGECHLDAVMIQNALLDLDLDQIDFLLVENVGNLVCPVSFKLGTHLNILIASIPEGDDKPYKYPAIYQGIDLLIVNKIDLLPYVPFRMDYFLKGVEILNPGIKVFHISCQTQEGIESWLSWIIDQIESYKQPLKLRN